MKKIFAVSLLSVCIAVCPHQAWCASSGESASDVSKGASGTPDTNSAESSSKTEALIKQNKELVKAWQDREAANAALQKEVEGLKKSLQLASDEVQKLHSDIDSKESRLKMLASERDKLSADDQSKKLSDELDRTSLALKQKEQELQIAASKDASQIREISALKEKLALAMTYSGKTEDKPTSVDARDGGVDAPEETACKADAEPKTTLSASGTSCGDGPMPLTREKESAVVKAAIGKDIDRLKSDAVLIKRAIEAEKAKLGDIADKRKAVKNELREMTAGQAAAKKALERKEKSAKNKAASAKDTAVFAAAVEKAKEKIDALRAAGQDLEKKRDELDGEVSRAAAERGSALRAMSAKPAAAKGKVPVPKNAAAETDADKLKEDFKAADAKYNELCSARDKAGVDISSNVAERYRAEDELKAKVGQLEKQKTLEQDLAKLGPEIDKLKSKIEEIGAKLTALHTKDAELEKASSEIAARKKQLEADLKAKENSIRDLYADINGCAGKDMKKNGRTLKKDGMLKGAGSVSGAEDSAKNTSKITAELRKEVEALRKANNALKKDLGCVKAAQTTAERAERQAREKLGRSEEAMNKERLDVHYNLAVVYDKNGMYKDAEREYLKCLSIDPHDADVHYNLGILYDDKLNVNDKALTHYRKYLTFRPKGDDTEEVKKWMSNAEFEGRLGAVAK